MMGVKTPRKSKLGQVFCRHKRFFYGFNGTEQANSVLCGNWIYRVCSSCGKVYRYKFYIKDGKNVLPDKAMVIFYPHKNYMYCELYKDGEK